MENRHKFWGKILGNKIQKDKQAVWPLLLIQRKVNP